MHHEMALARLASDWGIVTNAKQLLTDDRMKRDFAYAMDAQPTLVTNPNAGVPSWLTQFVDPEVIRVLQTPNLGATILGEQKKGTWVDQTAWFTMLENTGEVSSYGDYNANGISDVNAQWESRQSYLFQTHITVGDLEVDRAGLARLNLVTEKQIAAAKTLDKFSDYSYHFGVTGLACYGILNDPSLPAALTPTTKAFSGSGTKWVYNGQVTATAAEIYSDFQMLFSQLTSTTFGVIDANTSFVLVMPNAVAAAMSAVNQYGITIRDFIKQSFPNVEIVTDPRYATTGGNVIQLIARQFDGSDTGYCAFNEKMRDHTIVRDTSNWKQKKTSGTWGAIIRYPLAFAQMIGV